MAHRRYTPILTFFLVAIVAACGGKRATTIVLPATPTFVAIGPAARLYYNDSPGLRDSARAVIRDPAEWASRWRQITSTQASPPALPSIDFAKEMVLMAGAGRMNPGDQIKIDSVSVQDQSISVVVRTTTECRPFPGEAYPLELVRVAASAKPIVWVERRGKSGC